ncbi:MAG: hypothetical protein LBU21_10510 [Treponema sp.]|jgi:hypothetical protein|nr:hypothetical protein [Treponema sp.]
MGLFIARISGGALGVLLIVFAFVLQILFRRTKLPVIGLRILSAIGIIGGVYIIFSSVRNLLRYTAGVSSVVTVSAPFLAFALALTIHFLMILLSASNPRVWRIPCSGLTVAILASLQLVFALFNLIRNWNNLTRGGMKEYLYIQLLALAFIVVDVLLSLILFVRTKQFAETAGTEPPALRIQ